MLKIVRNTYKKLLLLHRKCNASTVAVAMSGGIDSAVTALLLKQQGLDVVGIFMKNWDKDDELGSEICPIERDREDMLAVCQKLRIPSYEVDFSREYWIDVFEPFITAYKTGVLTPNPDVYCNRHIKFKKLRDYAFNKLGVDKLATGHYVRSSSSNSEYSETIPELLCGVDSSKDQSYFLSMTPGVNLRNCMFPIGHMKKAQVKEIGNEYFKNMNVVKKRESTGVCFIGERSMPSFLGEYMELHTGKFIDIESGLVVGQHDGKEIYTLGQKARIANQKHKYYVVKKHNKSNDIFVALGVNNPLMYCDNVNANLDEFSWIAGQPPAYISELDKHLVNDQSSREYCNPILKCKVRYREESLPCSVSIRWSSSMKKVIDFKLESKTFIVAPGQVVALYEGDKCLGGGIVNESDDIPFHL